MTYRRSSLTRIALLALGLAVACGKPPGDGPPPLPGEVVDFATLFEKNCSGCHGAEGTHGPARPLNDPVYLAVIDEDTLRRVVADGVEGTSMPGFSRAAGGLLTEAQVDALTRGLVTNWGDAGLAASLDAPPYAAPTGEAARGRAVYTESCARCHGPEGRGGSGPEAAGSIVEPSFLALTSDQGLRSAVLFGRPDLGAPDWRTIRGSGPLTERDVADLVAWLVSQRVEYPGHLGGAITGTKTEEDDD